MINKYAEPLPLQPLYLDNARLIAVNNGVGRWEVNPKTGRTQFIFGCPNCNVPKEEQP